MGQTVYLSERAGETAEGVFPDDVEAQVGAAFRNLELTLRETGAGWPDVVQLTSCHVGMREQAPVLLAVAAELLGRPVATWPSKTPAGAEHVVASRRRHRGRSLKRMIAVVSLVLSAAGLLVGCGGQATTAGSDEPAASQQPPAVSNAQARNEPVATISYRDGPSWSGRLGDTVQVDWHDQTSGETHGERIAVLAVRRLPNPDDDGGPDEFGDNYGAYEWKYGIKVRLTSLAASTARTPIAYQFLSLSDGTYSEDGVTGVGARGGPDPSHVGNSSAGWLYQWADEGFKPTEVLMPIGAWQARWSLE